MGQLKEYFDKVTYKSTYFLGDKVKGLWNKKPFTGTVALDHLVDLEEGPRIHVFLDKPIKINDKEITFITVRHADVKRVK